MGYPTELAKNRPFFTILKQKDGSVKCVGVGAKMKGISKSTGKMGDIPEATAEEYNQLASRYPKHIVKGTKKNDK